MLVGLNRILPGSQRLIKLLLIAFLLIAAGHLAGAQSVKNKSAPLVTAQNQPFMAKVGLQLYSLRAELAKDVPGTLARVKAMGFRQAEVYNLHGLSAPAFRQELDKNNITCQSFMVLYEPLRDSLDQVIQNAKALGASYVVCPWIPHQVGDFKLEDAQRAARDFNAIGKKLKAQGLAFYYHTHGYEFKPPTGENYFDYLVKHTDPQYVNFEMDVYYLTLAGQNPVTWLQKYPTRFQLMHLKDMKKATEVSFTGKAPVAWSVALGTGKVDFAALLRQAQQNNIHYYFIEDEAPTAIQQVPASYDYLKKLKF